MRALLPRFALVVLLGWAARDPARAAAPRALRVVALNTVLVEIAREVGGDQAAVNGLVRPGVDPHAFEPSAADLRVLVDRIRAGGSASARASARCSKPRKACRRPGRAPSASSAAPSGPICWRRSRRSRTPPPRIASAPSAR
jgi:hypothetical protein